MRHFTSEQIESLSGGFNKEGKVVQSEVTDRGRWSIYYTGVVKMNDDGKYYEIYWEEGATEMQECDYQDAQDAPEVEPVGQVSIRTVFVEKGAGDRVLSTPPDSDPLHDKPNEWGYLLEKAMSEVG